MPLTWLSPLGGEGDTSCRQPFPGHPGLSQPCFQRRLSGRCAFDCSIKERDRQCGCRAKFEAYVLNKFFTAANGEYLGHKLAHWLFTRRSSRGAVVFGFEFWVLGFGF
jgi:hypothetical protein